MNDLKRFELCESRKEGLENISIESRPADSMCIFCWSCEVKPDQVFETGESRLELGWIETVRPRDKMADIVKEEMRDRRWHDGEDREKLFRIQAVSPKGLTRWKRKGLADGKCRLTEGLDAEVEKDESMKATESV